MCTVAVVQNRCRVRLVIVRKDNVFQLYDTRVGCLLEQISAQIDRHRKDTYEEN